MATAVKNRDRRAERTRQMLRQAFLQVVREKGLTRVTVQDIVDQANVSRGTFYAHYSDKYALIEIIIREAFQRSVSKVTFAGKWNRKTLRSLVQAVFEYFKTIQHHRRSRDIGPVIDNAIHDELNIIILRWLKQSSPLDASTHMSLETMAQIISWMIFGAAVQWSSEANPMPADHMAQEVVTILMDGVAILLPEA